MFLEHGSFSQCCRSIWQSHCCLGTDFAQVHCESCDAFHTLITMAIHMTYRYSTPVGFSGDFFFFRLSYVLLAVEPFDRFIALAVMKRLSACHFCPWCKIIHNLVVLTETWSWVGRGRRVIASKFFHRFSGVVF